LDYVVTRNGTVTAKHELDKALRTFSVLDDSTLTIDCSITQADWTVALEGAEKSFWEKLLGGASEVVPQWIKALSVAMPDFKISFGKLDFFLTTNLLMPGKKLIEIDHDIGIQVPGDFYIVGKLITK